MGIQSLEDLDDEELLSLFDSTKKLLQTGLEKADSPISQKSHAIQQKLASIEQELKFRCLWESE
ncbi:MAG: hypothetical protein ACE5E9_07425 [Nitrospinaceae bacterium]